MHISFTNRGPDRVSLLIPVSLSSVPIDKEKETIKVLQKASKRKLEKSMANTDEDNTDIPPMKKQRVTTAQISHHHGPGKHGLDIKITLPWDINATQLHNLSKFQFELSLRVDNSSDNTSFYMKPFELPGSIIKLPSRIPFEDPVLEDKNPDLFFLYFPIEIRTHIITFLAMLSNPTIKQTEDRVINPDLFNSFTHFRLTCRKLYFMDYDLYTSVYLPHRQPIPIDEDENSKKNNKGDEITKSRKRIINPRCSMSLVISWSRPESFWLSWRCYIRICKKFPHSVYNLYQYYTREEDGGLNLNWIVIMCLMHDQIFINQRSGLIYTSKNINSRVLNSVCSETPEDVYDSTGHSIIKIEKSKAIMYPLNKMDLKEIMISIEERT
jgi:hypothetical protein